jgi:hypothetical protein
MQRRLYIGPLIPPECNVYVGGGGGEYKCNVMHGLVALIMVSEQYLNQFYLCEVLLPLYNFRT